MKIAISGSHGLVGSSLFSAFQSNGHNVIRLGRPGTNIDSGLENADAVIHLGGVNIASGRWTPKLKAEILESRTNGTRQLVSMLSRLRQPPKVFICASAIGYYGSSETTAFNEHSPKGQGFLADVCDAWEQEALAAEHKGIRVVLLRFGPILSLHGGMLERMLPIFKLGLGSPIGKGAQMISWIALDEILPIITFILEKNLISGPVNCVAPAPVSNTEFSRILAKLLKRPCGFNVPEPMIRLALGEMGEEMLLRGAKVTPTRLIQEGYTFHEPDLTTVLRRLLQIKSDFP